MLFEGLEGSLVPPAPYPEKKKNPEIISHAFVEKTEGLEMRMKQWPLAHG